MFSEVSCSVFHWCTWFLYLLHPQILMHGETCSHPVTPYSKSITPPSIWTTRWPETSLWDLCTWRASMWPKQATGRFKTTGTLVNTPQTPSCVWPASLCAYVLVISCLWFAPSRAAGREWHVGERRRSSRCLPHHPAALPLGRPGHQRLRAHVGQTQIPDGGTVWSVDSSTLSLTSCCPRLVHSSFNVSVHIFFVVYF